MKILYSLKRIIFFNIFLALSSGFGQNYELEKFISNDTYFYNGVIKDNTIYFGSSKGVMKYDDDNFSISNPDLIGPIKIEKDQIVKGQVEIIENYKNLMPPNYQNSSLTSFLFKKKIYVFSKGKVFVFVDNDVPFKAYKSVRSISTNYTGTYEGVFDANGLKLDYPKYVNNYIREFENVTFFCWSGLFILKNGNPINVFDGLYQWEADNNISEIYDVAEKEHPLYYLSTNNGLYSFDVNSLEVDEVYEKKGEPFKLRLNSDQNDFLLFFDKQNIYILKKDSNLVEKIYSSPEAILDLVVTFSNVFYLLTTDKVLYVEVNDPDGYEIIDQNLINVNNIGIFNNYLYVTTDLGLNIINRTNGEVIRDVIIDEFNEKAHYLDGDTLKLGSINGLYKLTYNKLEELIDNKRAVDNIVFNEENPINYYNPYIIIGAFSLLILILILSAINLNRNKNKLIITDGVDLKKSIQEFINENINIITVKMICDHYNLSVNNLYEIMGKVTPGDIIRKERVKMVLKLRKQMASEEEISKQTGFSISYLKKI